MVKFQEIIGHERQREALATDMHTGNIAHAYLFSGPAHLGKMSLAYAFARDLLTSGKDEQAAKQTERQMEHLMHPDLMVLDKLWIEDVCDDWEVIAKFSNVPQVHRSKKPGAKTDSISIDDIRMLQEHLYGTAIGRYRCCIIRCVERMQDAAANAFLKILEEPPPNLVFLLTTQEQSLLLPTIVSRARVLPFMRLAGKTIRSLLSGMEEDDARFILHLARGAPGTAMRLAADPDLLRQHKISHGSAQTFWRSSNAGERIKLLRPLQERGEDADMLLLHLGLTLRERMPAVVPAHAEAYARLAFDLETNAHRQLLAARFASEVGVV